MKVVYTCGFSFRAMGSVQKGHLNPSDATRKAHTRTIKEYESKHL